MITWLAHLFITACISIVHRVSDETHSTAHLVTKPNSKVLTNSNYNYTNSKRYGDEKKHKEFVPHFKWWRWRGNCVNEHKWDLYSSVVCSSDYDVDKHGNTDLTCLPLSRLEWYVARTVKTYHNKNEVRLDTMLTVYHQITMHTDVQTITAMIRFSLKYGHRMCLF